MSYRTIDDIQNEQHGSLTKVVAVAASTASDTVIKAAPGRLLRILVTTTGTNPMTIHDNASAGSGTVIGALPASPAVGSSYQFDLPAGAGITVKGNSNNPAVTISFA